MAQQLVCVLIACLVLVPLRSLPAQASDDQDIERLVKQLGSDDFQKREAASKRLAEMGEPALDALRQATTSDEPEVRFRAQHIVSAIEEAIDDKLYPELRLTGHTSEVWSISVSADGKRVLTSSGDMLTSSADTTLRLWDADTGQCLRVFEGHTRRIVGAALSPDGQRVLSGSDDKTVRLWDATTGKELQKMTGDTDAGVVDGPFHLAVFSVAFGPEGKAISGGWDKTVRLWDLNTGKQAAVFTGHTDPVMRVAYSGKARLAATSSHDQSIRLWDLETGKEVRKVVTGTNVGPDTSVCFSPDGKRLVSAGGGGDQLMRIWDVETGQELQRIQIANAYCAAFSPDGKRLVSGSYSDHTVRVWDVESGKELRKYEGHTAAVTSVAYFPDGKRIASASADGTVRIWRVPRAENILHGSEGK